MSLVQRARAVDQGHLVAACRERVPLRPRSRQVDRRRPGVDAKDVVSVTFQRRLQRGDIRGLDADVEAGFIAGALRGTPGNDAARTAL